MSRFCVYSNVYILVSATVTVLNTGTAVNPNNSKNKIIKKCAPFTNSIREINNTQIDNTKDIDIVISMYNLIELVIIILKHVEVYGITTEMKHFCGLMVLLLISLLITITVLCLNLKQK